MFNQTETAMIFKELLNTVYMTFAGTFMAYVLGLPMGILLAVSDKGGIRPMRIVFGVLNIAVNIVRSVPFLILAVAIIPFTRLIVGTTIGPAATVVALVVAAAPFVARLVESSIKEIDRGVIEAVEAMGSSRWQIICKVMLPETRSSLLMGATIAAITILGYSAMAGAFGGGGLGDVAIRYGYIRYRSDMMLVTVAIMIVIVQLIQEGGMRLAKRLNKK